jgi:hypothetical protein
VKETKNIELPIGNLNVMQIATILNNYMVNHVLVTYDSMANKFTFTRKHQPSTNDFTTALRGISCCNFIGFVDIDITYEGVKSTNKINVITLKANNIKVQGDINMIKCTIDNFHLVNFNQMIFYFIKV